MIGVNDFGILPNPGFTSRTNLPVEVSEDWGRAVGVSEGKISTKYIRMLEEIWEDTHGSNA